MIFWVKKEFFLKFLKLAGLVAVEKKIGNNIFGSHALLSAVANKLSLIASDLDVELIVEEELPSVEEDGSAIIPLRKISEICRAMTDDVDLHVVTSKTSSKLHIKSDQGFFAINYLTEEQIPTLTDKMFTSEFSIKVRILQDLINKTAFAMGDDDSRQFLNGVFLCFSAKEIKSVATDGHRLIIREEDFLINEDLVNLKEEVKILLPKKSVFDLLKILGEVPIGVMATVCVGEHHIRVIVNNITFTSKLLAASFPAYQKLIPAQINNIVTAHREKLKASFLRAAALLGDRSQGVKLIVSSNNLQLTAQNDSGDLIEENIDVNYSGTPVEICFNIKYLIDFLSSINSEEVLLKIENSKCGALIQDIFLKSSYVLMPMQL